MLGHYFVKRSTVGKRVLYVVPNQILKKQVIEKMTLVSDVEINVIL